MSANEKARHIFFPLFKFSKWLASTSVSRFEHCKFLFAIRAPIQNLIHATKHFLLASFSLVVNDETIVNIFCNSIRMMYIFLFFKTFVNYSAFCMNEWSVQVELEIWNDFLCLFSIILWIMSEYTYGGASHFKSSVHSELLRFLHVTMIWN